ncbi:hypothetical protein FOZ63_006734, partial [Perkinsus olseni]
MSSLHGSYETSLGLPSKVVARSNCDQLSVTGRHRFRYFRRPLVGGLSVNPVISTEVDDAGLPWMAPRAMPTSTVLATENSNTRANAV